MNCTFLSFKETEIQKVFFYTRHKSHDIITFTIKPIKYVLRIDLFN